MSQAQQYVDVHDGYYWPARLFSTTLSGKSYCCAELTTTTLGFGFSKCQAGMGSSSST